jgi:ligand-binding sensor domain-containing protein
MTDFVAEAVEAAEDRLSDDLDAVLVRQALDLPRQTLGTLADALGVQRHNLASYRDGRARMPDRVRVALAAELYRLAREIEAAAHDISATVAVPT